jgi:hypothetical protein
MSSHILELNLIPDLGGNKIHLNRNSIMVVCRDRYIIEKAVWTQRKGFLAWFFNIEDKIKNEVYAECTYVRLGDNTSYRVTEPLSAVLDMWEGETSQKSGL